jgi:hypothetical protein
MIIYTSLFALLCAMVVVPMWCLGLRMISNYTEAGQFRGTPIEFVSNPVDKKLFWFVRAYFMRKHQFIGRPIITCVSCMPSIHTLYVMAILYIGLEVSFTLWFIPCYIFVAVSSSFTCGYWWSKFQNNG